jgi:hypothetical protein
MRALVRVGMKYGDGWALYELIEIEYSDGTILILGLRPVSSFDKRNKVVYIFANGESRTV